MTSASPEINKVIRRILSPTLRENGFTIVKTRTNWGYHGPCIWMLKLRAVGWEFSEVTGWPPMSIVVDTGIFYEFIPFDRAMKKSDDSRLLPQEYDCHMRSELTSTLNQSRFKRRLEVWAERERKEIWWIERDLSNTEEVVTNIRYSFLEQGLPWFQKFSDLQAAFAEIERERDCLYKYERACYFARHLGHSAKEERYCSLAKQERVEIEATVAKYHRKRKKSEVG
jgi:Domain of unknown function (DUF4304)